MAKLPEPTENTLAGIPLLGTSPIRWSLKSGTQPNRETFDVMPGHDDELLKKGKPVKLKLKSGGNEVIIKDLFIIHKGPGLNPHVQQVVVVDRRFWWGYNFINRNYNERRRVGFRRAGTQAPEQLRPVVDKVWYKRYSLQNIAPNVPGGAGKRWHAKDVIKDIFNAIKVGEERVNGFSPLGITFRKGIGEKLKDMPIDNLFIKDFADLAMTRILRTMPEVDLYINAQGRVVIYSKTDGTEEILIKALGAQFMGRGNQSKIDNDIVRAREVHVMFPREAEVRFDFFETATKSTTVPGIGETRQVENVLPSPDFNLTITLPDGTQDIVTQGTYITINQALNSVEWKDAPKGSGLDQIDHPIIQEAFVTYMDLWGILRLAGITDPDADWSARLSALQQHYRRTYRINPEWMDRIQNIRAYRVGTVDIVSGQRAPAAAFLDYAILHTQRSLFRDDNQGRDLLYAINVEGFPKSNLIDKDAHPAPAEVQIVDADQGIIRIDFRSDPNRVFEQFLPSLIENVPTENLGNDKRSVAFNAVLKTSINRPPKLSASHRMTFIITAVPGAPNSDLQLHRIVVKPGEILDLLPNKKALGESVGPPQELFIDHETARSVWSDKPDDVRVIEEMFGIPSVPRDGDTPISPPELDQGLALSNKAKRLTVNHGVMKDSLNAGSLTGFARAAAARYYAGLIDRHEGQLTGHIVSGIEPTGWVSEVRHEVDARGVGTTSITLPEKIPSLDLYAFLGDGNRRVLAKIPPDPL